VFVSTQTDPSGPPGASFWRSLTIQRRVIVALMMREVITRFGRHNLGALWLIAEPMIFTVGVATVWSLADTGRGDGLPIIAFAITGYSTVLMWRNTVSHSVGAIHSNFNLLFHRNVKVIDLLLTRILLEIGGATASFILLVLIFLIAEKIEPPQDLMRVLFGWCMLAWFGLGLGLTVGAATAYTPIVERIWQPIAYLLFPLSGAAYMADWLPQGTRDILLLLPMVHSVEYIREGFFGPAVTYHYDMAYMAACNLGLTLVGLWLVRDAGYRVESE
jgi:ABC-type polysaccharide/polyol phosphate export permease